MRKLLFLIMIMLTFPVGVKASYGDLIYGVEEVDFDGDKMTIEGWAYPDRINSIGGQNYIVNIIAAKKTDVDMYGTSYESFSTKLIKTSMEYSGYYMLYPKTCFRDSGKCFEKYYGANGDGWHTGLNYFSCKPSDYKTSCIYYNPKFYIEFSNTELQDAFGSDEITFLIELRYYDFGSGSGKIGRRNTSISSSDTNSSCDYSYTGIVRQNKLYNGADYYIDTAYDEDCNAVNNASLTLSVVRKKLTFDASCLDDTDIVGTLMSNGSGTVNTATINWDGFSEVKVKMPNKFYVEGGDRALFLNHMGTQHKLTSGCSGNSCIYFPSSYTATIKRNETKRNRSYSDSNLGNLANGELNLYYDSGFDRYMWSAWGYFNGEVVMSVSEIAPTPPSVGCSAYTKSDSCEISMANIDSANCSKYVDITVKTKELNTGGCSDEGSFTIRKVYKFSEKTELNTKVDPLSPSSSSVFTTADKPFPGLKLKNEIGFQFTRTFKWEEYRTTEEAYYLVKKYSGTGCPCQGCSTDLYVTKNYLKTNLSQPNYTVKIGGTYETVTKDALLNGDDSLFDKVIASQYKVGSSKLEYKYPSSNDVNNYYTETSDSIMYCETPSADRHKVFLGSRKIETIVKYKIKDAHVDTKYGNGHVEYDNVSLIDYDKVGKYYFIPFYVKRGDKIRFLTRRKDVSVLIDNINLESNCELDITDDGPISNYMYRVIDITNPFPNFKPGELDSNGKQRAKNWETIWNDSLKFDSGNNLYLLDRYNDLNAEKYTANLKPSNIDLIRVYNNTNSYIKSSINDYGESIYINNNTGTGKIFTRNFPLFKKVSESGVE